MPGRTRPAHCGGPESSDSLSSSVGPSHSLQSARSQGASYPILSSRHVPAKAKTQGQKAELRWQGWRMSTDSTGCSGWGSFVAWLWGDGF